MNLAATKTDKFIAKTLYGLATASSKRGRSSKDVRGFYEPSEFSFVSTVLEKKATLVEETMRLLDREADIPSFQQIAQLSDQRRKTDVDANWKNFVLILNDERIEDNCARCPGIMSVLENDIPGVRLALLSILHGNTKIAEHEGEQNGLLRLHIPIMIPAGGTCGISVDGETRNWADEEAMVFDHSFRHSAWNDSDDIRVILIIDFDRKLRFPWSALNRFAIKSLSKTRHFKEVKERSRMAGPEL